jgi:hypothetical protein
MFAIIILLLSLIGIIVYLYVKLHKCQNKNQKRTPTMQSAAAYTSCTQYKSKSGCTNSALNCQWDGSSCSSSGGGDSGGDSGGGGDDGGDSGGGGGDDGGDDGGGGDVSGAPLVYGIDGKPKQWVFILKLGEGGNNCERAGEAYHCKYLYADNTNQTLQLVPSNISDKDSSNPLYNTWAQAKSNSFVSWNDDPHNWGASSDHASPMAHDKGWVIYNKNGGVLCAHSCPNWGMQTEFLPNQSKTPGIETDLAQHFFLLQLSASDLPTVASLMNQANVTVNEGSFPGYVGPKSQLHPGLLEKKVNGVTIVAKGSGPSFDGYDIYSALRNEYCNSAQMKVYSFCSPPCPLGVGQSKDPINNIIDVSNDTGGLSTKCQLNFDEFKKNHSKIAVCDSSNSDIVILGGNNHSINSQGERGGLFIVLKSAQIANQLRCLFS